MMRLLRIAAIFVSLGVAAAAGAEALPYRFLLVIGKQWKDPASKLIESGGEFPVVVALLKSWGLPFDILRLDQQRFDRYYLLDREGRPRYGTIIWDAGAGAANPKDMPLLGELVNRQGLGLVALGETVAIPEVAAALGLEYRSQYR